MSHLIEKYFSLINLKVRLWNWPMMVLTNRKQVELIKRNKELAGIHSNERCFILGNGPSLKDLDFSVLSNEYTFTVNQLSRNPQFPLLKTNYHFWADPIFFQIDLSKPEDVELLDYMKAVKDNVNSPKVFYPVDSEDFIKNFEIDKYLDVNYFNPAMYFTKNIKRIDYAKIVPAFGTVVQYCITMAIYMGFKEIYLLGCDNTGLINNINSAMKVPVTDYTYEISDNEQRRMENHLQQRRLIDFVKTYEATLRDYEALGYYCDKNGILLRNCTPYSAIDCIPKCNLDDILK